MATLALCIPAYNAEPYLPRLLISAASQQIPFEEVLVYNDCSSDSTQWVSKQLGATVITGKTNKGCSYGKNILANATECEWIHFHDADDDLLPNFTEEIHRWIKHSGNSFDVLLLNFHYVNHVNGEIIGGGNHNISELHIDPLKYAITHKIVNFGVYNKHKFIEAGGFDLDENVLYNEDNALHQRLAKHGLRFDYLDIVTCVNFFYPTSMSNTNRLKCARAHFHVLFKTAKTHGDKYRFEIARQAWMNATILASVQDWKYIRKSLALIKKLGYYTFSEDIKFDMIAYFSPFLAFWGREKLIRLFKPGIRRYA